MNLPPSTRRTRGQVLRFFGVRLGGAVVIVYVLLLALLYFAQEILLFPGHASQGKPDSQVAPRLGMEIVDLATPSRDRLVAIFGAATSPDGALLPDAAGRPTLLYFYGNGQRLAGELELFATLRGFGLNVMMVDYPGYGMSGGRPSEAGCYAAADACYAHLLLRKDIDPARILVGGFSLGGAVAIDLASRKTVIGLVTSSTFADLTRSAQARYRFVPIPLLLRHRFASLSKIARVSCPILMGHGTHDSVVPLSEFDLLASAATVPVTRIVREDLGHDDIIRFADAPSRLALKTFFESL